MEPKKEKADVVQDNPLTEPESNKVKVFKKANDCMTQFCGEPVRVAEDGREYFDLHDYMEPVVKQNHNLIWPVAPETEVAE